MALAIRPASAADAAGCGEIIHQAFRKIAQDHGFPPDFPSVEVATELARAFIAAPSVHAVVAEEDGRVVGSNFLVESDPIRAVGPITVAPGRQGSGIGRRLMQAVLERASGAMGVRLVQDAFNTRSVALYAALGFEVKEPLLLLQGRPRSAPLPGFEVRPLTRADLAACAELSRRVHGVERTGELEGALELWAPCLVARQGRPVGYLSAATFWIANHGLARTEEDMRALLLGAAALGPEPLSFLLPTRQAGLFRWCLEEGLSVVKPMVLMAMGRYQEPEGAWFPSVFY
jgi:predicted N-acetyltransferase YhbS